MPSTVKTLVSDTTYSAVTWSPAGAPADGDKLVINVAGFTFDVSPGIRFGDAALSSPRARALLDEGGLAAVWAAVGAA